ncbi:MAG: hypothetical protein ACREQ5_35730, partial [Candidatus Dormibacteria bacterium]
MNLNSKQDVSPPWTRILILLLSLAALAFVARMTTSKFIPTDPKVALIFQNALLLIVLGSALLEHKFTKPADSAYNGLMGALTLLPVYGSPDKWIWWLIFLYCVFVCLTAIVCVTVSSSPIPTGWRKHVADFTYRPAVLFGKSRWLYSVVFLYGVFSFYGTGSPQLAILVLFWGIFIAIWPLGLPELLAAFRRRKSNSLAIGRVVRTDAPNIIRAELAANTK